MSICIELDALPVRDNRRRVLCGCMINNEINALDWRLHELENVVDEFIVVESVLTHSGNPRDLLGLENHPRFDDFADRLHPIVIRDPPTDPDPWVRERSQRVAIWTRAAAALSTSPDDLVIISDVDEVPFPEVVDRLAFAQFDEPIGLRPHWFNFNWNTYLGPWAHASIMCFPAGRLRDICKSGNDLGIDLKSIPISELAGIAGWHASWFGSDDFIFNKLTAYAHAFDGKDQALAAQGTRGIDRRRSSGFDLHRQRRAIAATVRLPAHAHRMTGAD